MLFKPKPPVKYNGIISAEFKNGLLVKLKSNLNTPDERFVPFVENLIQSLSEIYPDDGISGLQRVSEEYFVPEDAPVFLQAILSAGISTDREASTNAYGCAVVQAVISTVRDIVL